MRILDRYVLKELIGIFLFGIIAFSSIFVGTGVLFRIAQYMSQYGAPLSAVIRLFFYSLPEIINYTFPMAMLIASLLCVGRLSGTSEITAMQSGGISFKRIAAPILVVAFLVSAFSVIFAEKVVPASKLAYRNIVRIEIMHNTKPRSQDHIVIKNISGGDISTLTYAKSFDEKEGKFTDVTIEQFADGKLTKIQKAKTAIWADNAWHMYDGVVYEVVEDKGVQRSMDFKEQIMPLAEPPAEISRAQKDEEEMTIAELRDMIKVLNEKEISTTKYEMEMYQRFTIPMASFVFALVGIPLGMQKQRSSSSIGLGISAIVIFFYYTVMTVGMALGKGGSVPPIIAAWIPDILCGLIGIWLIRQKEN